jgi:uncharacterized DUF497 family protein
MIDLARIAGFEWDDGNARKNIDKPAVAQAEAEQIFNCERLLITDDGRHSGTESRYQALGETLDGRRLHVTFTLRHDGTLIRVISARNMNRKERVRYEDEA